MFKRLFWLVIGASFGFGMSFWVTRAVKQTVARYTPERVSTDLAGALRALGQDLRAAVSEGREAMREHERALRAELAEPVVPAKPVEPAVPAKQVERVEPGPATGSAGISRSAR